MAARYANPANIVAQGQSFYTGLLPGSYENTGGVQQGNVYGKGSGGSAGVSADRTGSEAAGLSLAYKAQKDGPTLKTIFKPGDDPSDTDRIVKAIKEGPDDSSGLPTPGPTQKGGGTPHGPYGPTAVGRSRQLSTGTGTVGVQQPGGPGAGGGSPKLLNVSKVPRTAEQKAATAAKRAETKRLREVGEAAEGLGGGHGTGTTGLVPAADLTFAMTEVTKSKGPTDYIKDSSMGQWSGSVQRRASTRSQTRQSGVQQSATHKSFLYPNMANSTNRALNF